MALYLSWTFGLQRLLPPIPVYAKTLEFDLTLVPMWVPAYFFLRFNVPLDIAGAKRRYELKHRPEPYSYADQRALFRKNINRVRKDLRPIWRWLNA